MTDEEKRELGIFFSFSSSFWLACWLACFYYYKKNSLMIDGFILYFFFSSHFHIRARLFSFDVAAG